MNSTELRWLNETYQPIAYLGQGASVQCYAIRNRINGCTVALRIPQSGLVRPPTVHEREAFSQEKWALHRLKGDPRVTKLLWTSCDSPLRGMIVEFIPFLAGMDVEPRYLWLLDIVESTRTGHAFLTFQEAWRMLGTLLETLVAFHQKGVVYPDLKPHHVCYDPDKNRLHLLDFNVVFEFDCRNSVDGNARQELYQMVAGLFAGAASGRRLVIFEDAGYRQVDARSALNTCVSELTDPFQQWALPFLRQCLDGTCQSVEEALALYKRYGLPCDNDKCDGCQTVEDTAARIRHFDSFPFGHSNVILDDSHRAELDRLRRIAPTYRGPRTVRREGIREMLDRLTKEGQFGVNPFLHVGGYRFDDLAQILPTVGDLDHKEWIRYVLQGVKYIWPAWQPEPSRNSDSCRFARQPGQFASRSTSQQATTASASILARVRSWFASVFRRYSRGKGRDPR